jgi:hypothetical protein
MVKVDVANQVANMPAVQESGSAQSKTPANAGISGANFQGMIPPGQDNTGVTQVAQASLAQAGITELTAAQEAAVNEIQNSNQAGWNNVLQGVGGLMQASGTQPNTDGLQSRWSEFIAQVGSEKGALVDINSLVQAVLREAYMENTKDLHFYAQKVRYFNEVKKAMRDELTRAREALTDSVTSASEAVTEGDIEDAGEFVVNYGSTDVNAEAFGDVDEITGELGAGGNIETKADLETYIQGLEEKLNSVGDDAQLANVDLQNMLQKQQQTLQMMSNISKMLHDTAMAIIRKIGG